MSEAAASGDLSAKAALPLASWLLGPGSVGAGSDNANGGAAEANGNAEVTGAGEADGAAEAKGVAEDGDAEAGDGAAESRSAEGVAEAEGNAEGGGSEAGVEDDEEPWRAFTPTDVDFGRCMARTWGSGRGGQCNNKLLGGGNDFCKVHQGKWEVHGRVDGPIPEAKLREFRNANKSHAGSGAARAGAKPKPGARAPASAEAKEARAAEKAQEAGAAENAQTAQAAKEAARQAREAREAEREAERAKREMEKEHALLQRAAEREEAEARRQAEKRARAEVAEAARAEKRRKAQEESKTKCTCGCPLHKEKCPAFKRTFQAEIPGPNARPFPQSEAPKPQPAPGAMRPHAAPAARMTAWARQEVSTIQSTIEKLPRQHRRSAWKEQMLIYHPDKRRAREDRRFANHSEEEVTEVFREIKRRYDHMIA